MFKLRTLGRWTARSLRVAALAGAVVFGAALVEAQGPTTPGGRTFAVKKTFTKNNTFNLPIQMDEQTRANLREVRLFVKVGSSDWVMQETAAPTTPHFTYRVPTDGEYWFSLVTVERSGKQTPADVNAEPPALRVVVDTRPPVLEATVTPEFNEYVLRVTLADANPDPQTLRAAVVTEAGDRALAPIPGQNAFRLTGADLSSPIRIVASDLSGNVGSRDVIARDLLSAAGVPVARNDAPPPITTAPPPIISQGAPPPIPVPAPAPYVPTPAPNYTPPAAAYTPQPAPYAPPVTTTGYRPNADLGDRPANRKLINTTRAQLEYRIDTVGPSGIGRVDVYMTSDRGQSWNKLGEDTDKRSPADVDLPGEGLFGLRLAIANGNGFGGRAPKAGDRPQFFIEVDATSPNVALHPYEMVPNAGAIDIRWTASDANLGPEPVNLFYRTRSDNGWQSIARNVKNDGVFRWVFPRDVGAHLFLKLEVADLAGNVTKVETPTPILLDQTEPEATLVDIVGVNRNGQPGAGPTPGAMPSIPSAPNLAPPSLPSIPGR